MILFDDLVSSWLLPSPKRLSNCVHHLSQWAGGMVLVCVIGLLPSQAQSEPPPPNRLLANVPSCPTIGSVLPDPPLSQIQLSIPSLWRMVQQSGGKLLSQWYIASDSQGPLSSDRPWVTLVVNRQLWSLSDYLERYRFIYQFGTVAAQYGYGTIVCNKQGLLVGMYSCNFGLSALPSQCQIRIDALGMTSDRQNKP